MKNNFNIGALLLAAGLGSRLNPLTNQWPKCLMPIGNKPLLEYWLNIVKNLNIDKVLINLHHHHDVVKEFLELDHFKKSYNYVYEDKLLGTAGTLRANLSFFENKTILLAHSDNLCICDFNSFLYYHLNKRPKNCLITMMTFDTTEPELCGIVEVDDQKIVQHIHEKKNKPFGNVANGAVYLIEPEVMFWLKSNPNYSDFSTEILPKFIGRIATWHNFETHIDIGSFSNLKKAQLINKPVSSWNDEDIWYKNFQQKIIPNLIKNLNNYYEK